MNIFRSSLPRALAVAAVLPLLASFLAACDVDSTDSTTAVVSDNSGTIYSYAGLYMRATSSSNASAALVYPEGKQSGIVLTWLRLLQYGSALEGYDNANQTWTGSISAQNGAVASFTLSGKTSAGASVEIVGTLTTSSGTETGTPSTNKAAAMLAKASGASATMDASWLETGFSGSIFAQATTAPATSNANTRLSIDPTRAALNSNDVTQVFTASGGTGTYTWTLSSTNYGSLSSSGNQATFTASGVAGSVTVTITDSSGDSASATITYSGEDADGDTVAHSISPSSATMSGTQNTIEFTARGGTSPYSWYVSSTILGNVNEDSGTVVKYTRSTNNAAGNTNHVNYIHLRDDDNNTVTATVTYTP